MLFVGLTFLVNWSLALLFFTLGGRWYTPAGTAVGAAYMFVPLCMAILVQRGIYREPVREPLGISFRLNRWFLIAWLLPPVAAFATLGVSLLLPGVEYSPHMQGMLLAPIFSYIRVKARSVIAAAIVHGTLNATYGLSVVLVRGGSDLTSGMTGLPGFIVLAVVIWILWLHDPDPQRGPQCPPEGQREARGADFMNPRSGPQC